VSEVGAVTTDARRRFPIGLTLAMLAALAILLALGTWQLQRLAWKRDLLVRIAALQAAPAQPLTPVLVRRASGEDVDFTRVTVVCPGLATAPFVELYGLRDGQSGSRLISACKLDGAAYGAILVDRGFVDGAISARPAVTADQAPMTVTGVLRSAEAASRFTPSNKPSLFFSRDVAAMAKALKAAGPAPVFLMAETSTNPDWKALVPAPIPAEIPNRHLEYALTWYGLAAALLGVYAAMLFKRRKS
jgi:surfeit locus 1 family protein